MYFSILNFSQYKLITLMTLFYLIPYINTIFLKKITFQSVSILDCFETYEIG